MSVCVAAGQRGAERAERQQRGSGRHQGSEPALRQQTHTERVKETLCTLLLVCRPSGEKHLQWNVQEEPEASRGRSHGRGDAPRPRGPEDPRHQQVLSVSSPITSRFLLCSGTELRRGPEESPVGQLGEPLGRSLGQGVHRCVPLRAPPHDE